MTLDEATLTLPDGTLLATYHKNPAKEHNKAILLFHGYAEYTDRYRSFITRLSNEGYHVFALDYRGHGRSAGARGAVQSVQQLTKDATFWFEAIQRQHPSLDYMVFGHSMGGGLAIDFALQHQEKLKGVVLSAPLIALPDMVPGFVKAIGRILAALFPALPLIPIDFDALSRDPGVVKRYREDPKIYSGRVKAGTAVALDVFTEYIQNRLHELKLPFWAGHGTLDRVTDAAGTKMLAARASSADKTTKMYHGLFHELLNEPEQEIVIHDILHWLRKRF
ncbi:MAG: lysophospholipase [Bacteroidetes bacterium]|nr:lysophospholipase [Bacteroidota bacterium]MCH8523135.1 alpha/beta hydrolase [Balneolales bacterium]